VFGERFDLPALRDYASKTLHLPIKLLFPAGIRGGVQTYHMLGLGDMAIPGIFLALALAFDKHLVNERARKDGGEETSSSSSDDKGHVDLALASSSGALHGGAASSSIASSSTGEASTACDYLAAEAAAHGPLPAPAQRQYFYAARCGYMCGIALSIGASRLTGAAQPALLYLVPCVLLPIIARAKARNHLGLLWAGFPDDDDNGGFDDADGDDDAPDAKKGADDGISDLVKAEGVEHDEEAQVAGRSSNSASKSSPSEIHARFGNMKL